MFVENMFAFSFGGKEDFGKMYNVGDCFILEFYPEPVGIGFAIRDGVDADLKSVKQIKFRLASFKPVEATVEFKTVNSAGAPEKSENISLLERVKELTINIPNLRSQLKEIVIFFPRNGRCDSTNISISNVELLK